MSTDKCDPSEYDVPGSRGRECVCPQHQETVSPIPAVKMLFFLVAVSMGLATLRASGESCCSETSVLSG